MPAKLLLVDTLSVLYRGHYVMNRRPLRGKDGTVTSGLYFLLNELCALIDTNPDSRIVAVSDAPGPSFRKKLYPDYKANRPPTPEDLRKQTEIARELIPALGIPFVEKQGLEADDIIAGFAMESSVPVLVLSPDKDLLQLVNKNVSVLRPGKSGGAPTLVGQGDVVAIMGVPAEYVADLLALTGDSSDNIPGAKGIGPKSAVKLIQRFGGVSDIYRHLSDVKPLSLMEKLRASREMVELSLKLTKLNMPLPQDLKELDLSLKSPDSGIALPVLDRLSLTKTAERFGLNLTAAGGGKDAEIKPFSCKVNIVATLDGTDFGGDSPVCIDTETTSLDPLTADMIGFSLTSVQDESWYVPFAESESREELLRSLEILLNTRGYMAQNAKYDSRVLARYGIELPSPSEDPYLADYVLRPDARSHSLKKIVPFWLGKKMRTFDETTEGSGSLVSVSLETVAEYCCADSASTVALAKRMSREFQKDQQLEKLYREVELPLSSVLGRMENLGIGIDLDALRREGDLISSKISDLVKLASEQTGTTINLSSPAQVASVLFDKLRLDPAGKTKKGARSTEMSVLTKLKNTHPFVETLIEYRELSKLMNTYVKKLPRYINPKTGLIHTSFNQAVTATGRLSSSNPNLQNIPIRTNRGREIRRCFVPPSEGHVFVTADYSQIELRVLAHLAGEGELRRAYRANEDIHSRTAVALFGTADREHRRKAKEVNFSIIYGISAFGLARRLSVSRREASDIISRYYETYPEVERFYREMVEVAEKTGEIRTILGRKRVFGGIKKANGSYRRQMERAAVNSSVQGSAADIIKLAMIKVDNALRKELPEAGLVLQVHDELVVTCPEGAVSLVESVLRAEMQGAFPLEVPLTVETGVGSNWLDAGH